MEEENKILVPCEYGREMMAQLLPTFVDMAVQTKKIILCVGDSDKLKADLLLESLSLSVMNATAQILDAADEYGVDAKTANSYTSELELLTGALHAFITLK